MKKQFLALFMAIILTLAFCSCGGDAPGTTNGATGSESDSVSVSDTTGEESSSLPSDSGSASSGTDTGLVSDVTDTATDSGTKSEEIKTEDEEADEDTPVDDSGWNGGGGAAPEDDSEPDVYLPDYEEPSSDDESTSSSTNTTTSSKKNTSSNKAPTGDTTDDGGEDESSSTVSGNDPVVGNTLSGLMALTDQKSNKIVVVDLAKGDISSSSAKVWEWPVTSSQRNEYSVYLKHLDDAKIRNVKAGLFNGTVMGITTSAGLIAVVEYPSGKCLFKAYAPGTGPHDIEILPNGLVAVACSGNGDNSQAWLRVYRAASKTDGTCAQVRLYEAHGVLWDPTEKVLWALGGNELNAYTIGGSPSSTPTITQVSGKHVTGFAGGHCLAPMYDNPDRLWISTATSVYQYSKSMNMLYSNYSGSSRISSSAVKGVGSFANGTVVWSVADPYNETGAHNTNKVQIWYYNVTSSGKKIAAYKEVVFSNLDFYKVRVFDTAYQ